MHEIAGLGKAAAFALACTLILTPSLTMACSRPSDITEKDDFRNARYVFHALLIQAELGDDPTPSPGDSTSRIEFAGLRTVVGTYELKNAVKGTPPRRGRIVSTNGIIGGCALPLLAGQEYIFFVEPWPADTPAALSNMALGTVSIFGSISLTGYEPVTQEELTRLRSYVRN
jgi:hypothetical protein